MKKYISLALAAVMMMSLMACSAKPETTPNAGDDTTVTTPSDVTIDLEALSADIESKVELPALALADPMALEEYFGLAEGDLEEAFIRIPMMAVSAAEYGIMKGDADVITAALEKRMAGLETIWSQYLPDQYDLVLNYSTYTEGDYTMYVIAYEEDKVYFENCFQRAFDDSIEELVPAASFSNITAEVVSVEDNGVTVLVDGFTIAGTYTESCFINPDESTGEAYIPQVGDVVDMAFETEVVDNGDDVLTGAITYMGRSFQMDVAPEGDMGVGDMGVGDMGVGDMVGDMGVGDMAVEGGEFDVATQPMN